MSSPLPIDAALPGLAAALRERTALVLEAPPGAGKTTRLPPLLVREGYGRVVVLEPRRVAARAAARRIAEEQRWALGEGVGWHIRFEARYRRDTPLVFATEGVLLRWLQRDPLLEGVGAVVLDEVHERSLHTDLALALLREVREARPELRLVAMSATLDGEAVQRFLGGAERCALVRVEGRAHPVEVVYDARPDDRRLEDRVVAALRRVDAWDGGGDPSSAGSGGPGSGDVLVFLPGAGEIRRVQAAAAGLARERGWELLPLHGSLSGEDQDRALRPRGRAVRRKIVLATNIAETSLTIDGVSTVIDAGLERTLRHDPRVGVDRLVLGRITATSAAQRAGRAGRQGPGRAVRLWTEGEHRTLVPAPTPEILRVDLASTVLELRAWGARDPAAFGWLDAPPATSLAAADRLLELLGAVSGGAVTPLGQALLRLPLHPRVGRLLVATHAAGRLADGAAVAALVSEPDLGRDRGVWADVDGPSDLLARLELLRAAEDARFDPDRLRRVDARAARTVARVRDQLLDIARRTLGDAVGGAPGHARDDDAPLLRAMLDAYPDRVCRRRAPRSDRARMVGGHGVALDPASVVRSAELFVAVELGGPPTGVRADTTVRLASAVERDWIAEDLRASVIDETQVSWDPERRAAYATRVTRYDDLILAERQAPLGPAEAPEAARLLAEAAARDPRAALPFDGDAARLAARIAALHAFRPDLALPPLDDEDLRAWLPELCAGRRSLADLAALNLHAALTARLTWPQRQALEEQCPDRLEVQSGSHVRLDYRPGEPPILAVRLQEMFGCRTHPRVAGQPVVLHLLSPAMRPVQVTSDLPGFWTRTWPEVRKELRGRYPKHDWPEDPLTAPPRRRPGKARAG